MSIESNHLILCHRLFFRLQKLFQHQGLFQWAALCIRWSKYWSFNFGITPSNEYLGLTSFRIDWLDLFAVQGTLKNHHQCHNSKASVPHLSAFFIVLYRLKQLHCNPTMKGATSHYFHPTFFLTRLLCKLFLLYPWKYSKQTWYMIIHLIFNQPLHFMGTDTVKIWLKSKLRVSGFRKRYNMYLKGTSKSSTCVALEIKQGRQFFT